MKKKNSTTQKTEQKKTNVTTMKLNDVPFKTAKALKDAQEQIHLQVWRRLEEAKIIHEMLKLDKYKFWHEEFTNGLVCTYVIDESDMTLVKVSSEGHGIKICINKSLAVTAPLGETVLTQLVRSMTESFATTYYKAKGLLPNNIDNIKKNDFEV